MDLWVSSTMTLFVLLALAVCASCHIQIYDDTCWRKSVEAVERSCHTMGMEKQQQLALDSLNCHLQMSGREPYVCNGREFTQCLGAMDNTRFEMFAKFFSFVETTCQDQQIMSWQHSVEGELDDLLNTQDTVEEIQSEISKGQKKLNDGLDAAKETLQQLRFHFDTMASTLSELLASVAGLSTILNFTSTWLLADVSALGLVCLLLFLPVFRLRVIVIVTVEVVVEICLKNVETDYVVRM